MTVATVQKPKAAARNGTGSVRNLVTPLNLHWAGVGLLVLANLYLIGHMLFLWHDSSNYNADAMAQQQAAKQRAGVAVEPLRGLDAKLAAATGEADRFYRDRLPASDSGVAAELGALTKKAGVRLTGAGYLHEPVLAGSAGALTELQVDARLSGDYRPLVILLNSLERDKMFFVITRVALSGQQTGAVNLRLGLKTYERGIVPQDAAAPGSASAAGTDLSASAGGPR
jgi:hypothetical protein